MSCVQCIMMPVTAKRDGRSLDHRTNEELRRLAVSRVLAGESQSEVARSLQFARSAVVRWMRMYREGGDEALASRKAPGREPTLDEKQVAKLRRLVVGKNPSQLRLGGSLWTVALVQQLIEMNFGVVLHRTTVTRLLHRMGLTPQVPRKQSFQRDDEACRRWAQEEFPEIVRASKRRQSTILFSDEAGVHEDGPVGRTWAQKGARPVVKVTGQRRKVNVISAVSPRGRLWFRCFKGMLNARRFEEFLADLLADVKGPIDLVIDRHPAHVAASIRRFVYANRRRLRVHFLPPYAPDMNPDEHVWQHLKGLFRQDPVRPDEDLDTEVDVEMRKLECDRPRVRAFFGHPAVAYVREALNW